MTQSCTSSQTCTGSQHYAPSFFDTQMLTSVTTSVYEGSTPDQPVDTWDLGYEWQSSDVGEDLTLTSVTHHGVVGGSVKVAPVQLGWGQACLPNRVQYDSTFPAMDRCRLSDVTSETGAQTGISYNTYSLSVCNPGVSPAAPPPNPAEKSSHRRARWRLLRGVLRDHQPGLKEAVFRPGRR